MISLNLVVVDTISSPAPRTNPPKIPPGANPRAPMTAPAPAAFPTEGSLSLINLVTLGGRSPSFHSLPSNLPNNFSERVEEFLRIVAPAPTANPPSNPSPDPVTAAPTNAPRAPVAIVLGKSTLAAATVSDTVPLRF